MTTWSCLCSTYRTASGRTTGCTAITSNRFAPGHDAKLKSFLIAAGVAGESVVGTDGVKLTAVEHAELIGYGDQVANGVDLGIARNIAKKLEDMGTARDRE